MKLAEISSEVQDRARRVDVSRHLVGLGLAVPLLIGWVAGVVLRGGALVWAHVWAAVVIGFERGRG